MLYQYTEGMLPLSVGVWWPGVTVRVHLSTDPLLGRCSTHWRLLRTLKCYTAMRLRAGITR